jgi:glutamate synthase (ferredoxin)
MFLTSKLSRKRFVNLQKRETRVTFKIKNTDRSGAILVTRSLKFRSKGLPEDTILVDFEGSGRSKFWCFATNGLSFKIHGNCNDYLGKGLSGGKLIIKVPPTATLNLKILSLVT